MMIASYSSADLDAPAFPLNFDPELLLNDDSQTDDFHQWLQSELYIFSADSPGDLPHPTKPDGLLRSGASTPVPSSNKGQELQSTPGIFELFQLQALAPGASTMQHVPVQQMHWMEQQLQQQQQQQYELQLQQLSANTTVQQPQLQASLPFAAVSSMTAGVAAQSSFDGMQQYPLQLQPIHQQRIMAQQQQQYAYLLQHSASTLPLQSIQQRVQQQYPSTAAPAAYMAPAGPAMYGGLPANAGYLMPTAFMAPVAPMPLIHAPTDQLRGPDNGQQPVAAAGRLGSGNSSSRPKPRSKATDKPTAAGAAPVLPPDAEKPKGPSRRFRERQKETISNLEAEVIEKLAQLQALSAENEMLKLRSAVLEATVKGREYHMKIIREHGPPVFDASESADDVFMAMQQPAAAQTEGTAYSHSAASAGPAGNAHFCCSDTNADNATDADKGPVTGSEAALGLSSAQSHASTASGHAAGALVAADASSPSPRAAPAVAAAVMVKAEPGTGDASAAAAAVAAAEADAGCSLKCCDAPQMCSPAEQKKTIRTLKHMSAEDIIRHWKQFVHEVTGELLTAEQEEQEQKLRRQQAESASATASAAPSSGTTSAAASVAKVCRWCSCCENAEHTAEACEAEQQRRDQQQGQPAGSNTSTVEDRAFQAGAICGEDAVSCTVTEARITALVNKSSYMTKFVALLNPGVLYHLFGRHLDTGLPVPYSDDHWRQVVSRLGLSKHQVTVILACAELYFSSMNQLLEQRRALQQQLKHADEGLSECQRRLLGVDGGLNQLQVLDALASNLKREHVLRIMLNCFVWGRSLNSLQFAKSAVYSYPFFPDVHAMVCVLYEDARAMAPNGQPALVFPHRQAKALLAAGQQQHQQQSQLQALHDQLRA